MTGGIADPGIVCGIDHIGITVPDIEAATRFFHDAFNAAVVYDTVAGGRPHRSAQDLAATIALEDDRRIIATRIVRLGNSANIELFEVEGSDRSSEGIGTIGLHHFAVYCMDIAGTLRRVLAAGGTPLRGPNPLFGLEEGPGNAMQYVRAPWGTLIELISIPSGTAPGRDANRWHPRQE